MEVKGLDGKVYKMKLLGKVRPGETRPRSGFHLEARKLLNTLFPAYIVLEEVRLPGTDLTVDFFLPLLRFVVEVHGQQHYEYSRYFHGNLLGFIRAKKRDLRKKDWCDINNIKLVELPHYERVERWRERILKRDD